MANPYFYQDSAAVLQKIADDLEQVMDWSKTSEGHDYWEGVHLSLLEHADMARTRPGPGIRGMDGSGGETNDASRSKGPLVLTHILDKENLALCGFIQWTRGHSHVTLKEKEKSNCHLCKSKLVF